MLPLLFGVTGGIVGLTAFVCYILCVIKMFQNQDTTWGIISVVLFCLPIVALVRAYQKREEWEITNIVNIWLVAIVLSIIINVTSTAVVGTNPFTQWRSTSSSTP